MKHSLLTFVFIVLMVGCGDDAAKTAGGDTSDAVVPGDTSPIIDTSEDTAADTKLVQALISSVSVSVNPNNTLAAKVTVETTRDATVSIQFGTETVDSKTTGATPIGLTHSLDVVGMRAETTYTLTPLATDNDGAQEQGEPISFTTGSLPAGMPNFEVTVHDAGLVQPGITLFGIGIEVNQLDPTAPQYIGVDEAGEVVWYYLDPSSIDGRLLDREARMLGDGTLFISLQNEFRVISIGGDTLHSLKGGKAIGGGIHHDALRLPNGNYAVLSNQTQTVTVEELGGEVKVKGDRILEITPAGETVWQWSAFDHLDTTRFPTQLSKNQGKQNKSYDWTHANALVYDPTDDTFLVSLRHQNWIIKIEHESGNVVWRLGPEGDFTLNANDGAEWFYCQHAPEIQDDGTIVLFDNGNERPGNEKYSRGVHYSIDINAKTATQLWSYTTDKYASFLGDANRLPNGNYLVTAGGVRGEKQPNDPPGPAPLGRATIVETTGDATAKKVWELHSEGGAIYRANRITGFWTQIAVQNP